MHIGLANDTFQTKEMELNSLETKKKVLDCCVVHMAVKKKLIRSIGNVVLHKRSVSVTSKSEGKDQQTELLYTNSGKDS